MGETRIEYSRDGGVDGNFATSTSVLLSLFPGKFGKLSVAVKTRGLATWPGRGRPFEGPGLKPPKRKKLNMGVLKKIGKCFCSQGKTLARIFLFLLF